MALSNLNKRERTAIEAVAKRFSATWEEGSASAPVYITVAGKRLFVDVATLKLRGARQASTAKPRLRFDKVATRLMERLQAAFTDTVPDCVTVLLTVAAPIRLASKTAAALEDKIQTLLRCGSPRRDAKAAIHGNHVRIRLLRGESERAPKMIGFVHTSDSDPLLLLEMTRELLQGMSVAAARRAEKPTGERWLVLLSPRGISCWDAYRHIYSQLRTPAGFKNVFMVFADGRVELLAESKPRSARVT